MGNTCCNEEKESSQMNTSMKLTGKELKKPETNQNTVRSNYELNSSQIDKNHIPPASVAIACSTMNELDINVQSTFVSLTSFPRNIPNEKISNPEFGPFKYPKGETYEGQYLYGKRDGYGVCIFADGSLYEGLWENDKMDGKGRFIYTNEDVYEGDFKEGLPHGKGELKHQDGTGYDGDWVKGQKMGIGSEKWPDGTSYVGGFSMGMKHGKGVFRWPDGARHEGNFVDNRIEGKGNFFFKTLLRKARLAG